MASEIVLRGPQPGTVDDGPSIPTPETFRRVWHCLWALLVAGVGGIVGRACYASGQWGPG